MKPNQCRFCSSKKCYYRIHRDEAPRYDEVACRKHSKDLEAHADGTLGKGNGVMRMHRWSTAPISRGGAA